MNINSKLLTFALIGSFPLTIMNVQATEKIISEKTKMSDGTEVTVTKTIDVNAAAKPMAITKTTYSFDANKNGIIENDEVIYYVKRHVDTNNDGYIDVNEYESNSMTYFSNNKSKETETKSYTYWDKDKDNKLDSSEVETLVANKGYFKKWDLDKDGKIDSLEFAQATFLAYDDDKNGSISIDEWQDVVM